LTLGAVTQFLLKKKAEKVYKMNIGEHRSDSIVLIVGFKDDITTLHVEKALQARGVDVFILDTGEIGLSTKISYVIDEFKMSGQIEVEGNKIDINQIHSVWMRRTRERRLIEADIPNDNIEFMRFETEGAVTALLRILEGSKNIRFVSSPINMWVAENKPYQLWLASKCGLKIPKTLYSNDINESDNFVSRFGPDKLITKLIDTQSNIIVDQNDQKWAIATGVLSREKYIDSKHCIEEVPYCFQELIFPKIDVRATVVSRSIFAAAIYAEDVDWRMNDYRTLKHEIIELPKATEESCLKLMKSLGLQFGAIDLVIDQDNDYYFLEVNPAGQWLWIEDMVGLPITDALVNLLLASNDEQEGSNV
jgi:glutathione synthase/RimK-type ligase-like ATP-grasp enzyme